MEECEPVSGTTNTVVNTGDLEGRDTTSSMPDEELKAILAEASTLVQGIIDTVDRPFCEWTNEQQNAVEILHSCLDDEDIRNDFFKAPRWKLTLIIETIGDIFFGGRFKFVTYRVFNAHLDAIAPNALACTFTEPNGENHIYFNPRHEKWYDDGGRSRFETFMGTVLHEAAHVFFQVAGAEGRIPTTTGHHWAWQKVSCMIERRAITELGLSSKISLQRDCSLLREHHNGGLGVLLNREFAFCFGDKFSYDRDKNLLESKYDIEWLDEDFRLMYVCSAARCIPDQGDLEVFDPRYVKTISA